MKLSKPPGLPGTVLLLLLAALAHATPSIEVEPFVRGGNVLTVGPDAACDYESLQVAINAATGPTTIRLMNNYGETNSPYTINSKSLLIIGGYASCTAGAPLGRANPFEWAGFARGDEYSPRSGHGRTG
ncbi:MAG: hypothetical protein ACXIUL_12320 [Wenzhouxiangella sp.]